MSLIRIGVKRSVLICKGQTGKLLVQALRKWALFLHWTYIFHLLLQKTDTSIHLYISFMKSKRTELRHCNKFYFRKLKFVVSGSI